MVKTTRSDTIPMAIIRFKRCCFGNTIGDPDIKPCNLRNAIIEPEKVMAPIITPSPISIKLAKCISPTVPMPIDEGTYNAADATSTAARPTSEWNAATSCGIAVIAIFLAITRPIVPPINKPPRSNNKSIPPGGDMKSVVKAAMTIPIIPK